MLFLQIKRIIDLAVPTKTVSTISSSWNAYNFKDAAHNSLFLCWPIMAHHCQGHTNNGIVVDAMTKVHT